MGVNNGSGPSETDRDATGQSGLSSDHWHLIAAAATTALTPYIEEATEAAAEWVAERWPDYVEKTLLPALSDAVRDEEPTGGNDPAHSADGGDTSSASTKIDPLRAGALAGAAAAVLGAAGILLARR